MKPNTETLTRGTIECSRAPTLSEIRFGEGATHYKTMPIDQWLKPDGYLKRWTVCPIDGLRYYRLGS